MAKITIHTTNRERIYDALVRHGYSVRELAEQIGIHQSTIHNILDGKGNPSPKTAKLISEFLNIEFDDIFTFEKRGVIK